MTRISFFRMFSRLSVRTSSVVMAVLVASHYNVMSACLLMNMPASVR